MPVPQKKNANEAKTAAASARPRRRPENQMLIEQIAGLLHEYTEEEVNQLVERHLATAKPVKKRPRGRTAPKKDTADS